MHIACSCRSRCLRVVSFTVCLRLFLESIALVSLLQQRGTPENYCDGPGDCHTVRRLIALRAQRYSCFPHARQVVFQYQCRNAQCQNPRDMRNPASTFGRRSSFTMIYFLSHFTSSLSFSQTRHNDKRNHVFTFRCSVMCLWSNFDHTMNLSATLSQTVFLPPI